MPDNLYRRGKTFYARIQVNGEDVRKSLRTANRREASERLKVFLAKQSAYHGTIRQRFDDVMAAYMLDAERHLKPKTLERYSQSLMILTDQFGGQWWDAIDKRAVMDFVAKRKADGLSVRTIKNDLSVLSGAAEYALEQEWGGINPVAQLGKRQMRHKAKVFVLPPADDIELVLSCVAGPLEQLCQFLRHTGMRRDEAKELRWQDVDLQRGAATLPVTKNGTVRTVSLNPEAIAILKVRPHQIANDLVFTKNDGEQYEAVTQGFREARLRAFKKRPKLQRFRLHDLRHIYAIEYLQCGGNLYALQKQLGHGSIRQTEWYLQFLTPEEQERAKAGSAQNAAQMHRFTSSK